MKKIDEQTYFRHELTTKITRLLILGHKKANADIDALAKECADYAKFKTRKKK